MSTATRSADDAEPASSSVPLWLDTERGPLFARWTAPAEGGARGVVILCPSIGNEYVAVQYSFRLLARRLAHIGIASLRLDYFGVGDSAGTLDEATTRAWLDDLGRATTWVADHTDAPVVLLGNRVGAALVDAYLAAAARPMASVLWDPCSGRRFLRESWRRYLMTLVGPDSLSADSPDQIIRDSGGVPVLGYVIPAPLAADLGSLAEPSWKPTSPQLLLCRNLPAADPADTLRTARRVEQGVDFLDDPTLMAQPEDALSAVIEWVDATLGQDRQVVEPTVAAAETTVVPCGTSTVEETVVSIGAGRIFGVVAGADQTDSPLTVVCLNNAAERHLGPGRIWVELARELAVAGIRSLRADLSGLGESGQRPGQRREVNYPPEALDDIDDLVGFLGDRGWLPAVITGVCSGAYHAMEWGHTYGAAGVCAINPVLHLRPAEMEQGPIDPRRAMTSPMSQSLKTIGLSQRSRWLKDHLPSWAWQLMDVTGVYRAPTGGVERFVHSGSNLLLILGRQDALRYLRLAAPLRRLAATGRFRLRVIDEADHALLRATPRGEVRSEVLQYVATQVDLLRAGVADQAGVVASGTALTVAERRG